MTLSVVYLSRVMTAPSGSLFPDLRVEGATRSQKRILLLKLRVGDRHAVPGGRDKPTRQRKVRLTEGHRIKHHPPRSVLDHGQAI